MKKRIVVAAVLALSTLAGQALSQEVPLSTSFTYQGRLKLAGAPVNGNTDLRVSLWDSAVGGIQIVAPFIITPVPVTEGLFTTQINFGVAVFNGENRYLQVEARPTGAFVFSLINQRQLLTATPYALQTRGLFVDAGLNVGIGNTAPGARLDISGGANLTDRINFTPGTTPLMLGGHNNGVGLEKRMWIGHSASFPTWGIQYRDFSSDGFTNDTIEFTAGNQLTPRFGFELFPGIMRLYDGSTSPINSVVTIDAVGGSGGFISLNNESGVTTVELDGSNIPGSFAGGELRLRDSLGNANFTLTADGGGFGGGPSAGMSIMKGGSIADGFRFRTNNGGGGYLTVHSSTGAETVQLDGNENGGGHLTLLQTDGQFGVTMFGSNTSTTGGSGFFYQAGGTIGVDIRGSETSTTGGQILLRRADGTATIEIDADFNGFGRVITQELEITGGADLSENFDIADPAAEPGMVVCIDPASPGSLRLATKALDKTVAGVISGAGGVRPGLLMGQKGTKADGKMPVALTGRVYVYVDASNGKIEPGDFLTTSNTPGHAMRVTDSGAASGAIIGKAMTGLDSGKGLVLVLVNLN